MPSKLASTVGTPKEKSGIEPWLERMPSMRKMLGSKRLFMADAAPDRPPSYGLKGVIATAAALVPRIMRSWMTELARPKPAW